MVQLMRRSDASASTCAARLPLYFPGNHVKLLRTKRIRYIKQVFPLFQQHRLPMNVLV
jgi:hypothetical protein